MGLRPSMPPQELWFKSLSAHVLLVVTSLPNTSPLQVFRESLSPLLLIDHPVAKIVFFITTMYGIVIMGCSHLLTVSLSIFSNELLGNPAIWK
jgi:hypothetical protein